MKDKFRELEWSSRLIFKKVQKLQGVNNSDVNLIYIFFWDVRLLVNLQKEYIVVLYYVKCAL